jgi:outer membrane protein assembly factor BamB
MNQKGAIPILILMAVIGVAAVFVISSIAPFRNSLLSSLFPKESSFAAATDWPQLQNNPQHTGRTLVSVAPGYEVAWAWADKNHIVKNFVNGQFKSITDGFEAGYKFTVLFSQQVQPVIMSGKTFFGSMNGTMYAVNALTGDNVWDFTSGGPIVSTAAVEGGTLVFGSMDGKVYGLNAVTGAKVWERQIGPVSASPIISNSTVYVGSREGYFYALDLATGNEKWKYGVRAEPISTSSPLNLAPIFMPAAVSEDGTVVLFGAENMFFYGLNTNNGSEKWTPKKMIGQSFLYGWPVVKGDKVVVRTMSSLEGAEFVTESVLDGLGSSPTIAQERDAIQAWLNQNPTQKSMYVLNINTGAEAFQVAMGRVTGNNYTAFPPVVDNTDRLLSYFRGANSTFFSGGSFGTYHCPDMSGIDMTTGDRIQLSPGVPANAFCPELDNGFMPTVGGNYLYLANAFRGTHAISLTTGTHTRMTSPIAIWDCGNFRGWGYNVIYYGNDGASTSQCNPNPPDPRPEKIYGELTGFAGIAIASTNGTPMLYINEPDAGFIVALRHKP